MLQKHPRTGCLIAARWPDDFAFVAGAIRHYCGRWGGTEYPVSLAREDVPRYSRISAVAGVFDPTTDPRPFPSVLPLRQRGASESA